jgi:thiol:disulfide interchange protein DsbD
VLRFFYFNFIVLFLISFNLQAQDQKYVHMGATTFSVGTETYLALNFKNEKKWHTYWKNPGDAGLTMKMTFFKEDKVINLEETPWPAPKRYIEQGEMWAYGYGGTYSLFYKLPATYKNTQIKVVGEWLVCKDICIPGSQELILNLDSNLKARAGSYYANQVVIKQFESLPKPTTNNSINFYLTKGRNDKELALSYTIENIDESLINQKTNIIMPYPLDPLTYKHEEVYIDRSNKTLYGRMYVDWDGEYEEPVWPLPTDGIFKRNLTARFLLHYPKNENAKILTHTYTQFSLSGDKALTEAFKTFQETSASPQKNVATNTESILYYILFAFLGGLILNLMPCVLPVISLKLFGLIVHSDESKQKILKHNLAYTLGVLVSFLTLASVVYALKLSGDQIGWGFQLQSPIFVFSMLILIFVMALNMLGLFEFHTPGGKALGNAEMKTGFFADFINGVLATILSTPCSAPFLGTALTFAFTTSDINIFIIFLSVGLGLSFPFILTGFFPVLIKFLPKPGLWMDKLKRILGLTLLLTVIWLYDVLAALIDMELGGMYVNTILLMTFFAFYFRKHISNKFSGNLIICLIPIFLIAQALSSNVFDVKKTSSIESSSIWKRWSPEAMKTPKGYTFINFTASWCLTCKVNKKIVLQSDDFKDIVKAKNLRLLEGDWTKRDDNITNFLRSYNIVGVPAYFIQKPNGEIISLGETISIDKIIKNIKE